jgi:hypothetical protein
MIYHLIKSHYPSIMAHYLWLSYRKLSADLILCNFVVLYSKINECLNKMNVYREGIFYRISRDSQRFS